MSQYKCFECNRQFKNITECEKCGNDLCYDCANTLNGKPLCNGCYTDIISSTEKDYDNNDDVRGNDMKHLTEKMILGLFIIMMIFLYSVGTANALGNLTDLSATDPADWVGSAGSRSINGIASVNNNATTFYTIISSGLFGVYDRSTNIWTDLSTTDSGNFCGTNTGQSIFATDNSHVFNGYSSGLQTCKLTRYIQSSNTNNDLSNLDAGDWVLTSGVFSVVYHSNDNRFYTAHNNGKFGSIPPTAGANSWINLSDTDTADWISTTQMRALASDSTNNLVYIAGASGKFGVYNVTENITHDLSATDTADWVGTSQINSLSYNSINNIVYTGIAGGKFGMYNISDNVWTDLSTADENDFIGTNNILALSSKSDSSNIYIGGTLGTFGVYNINTGIIINLTETDIGNFWSTSNIASVLIDPINTSNVYIGGGNGKLGLYVEEQPPAPISVLPSTSFGYTCNGTINSQITSLEDIYGVYNLSTFAYSDGVIEYVNGFSDTACKFTNLSYIYSQSDFLINQSGIENFTLCTYVYNNGLDTEFDNMGSFSGTIGIGHDIVSNNLVTFVKNVSSNTILQSVNTSLNNGWNGVCQLFDYNTKDMILYVNGFYSSTTPFTDVDLRFSDIAFNFGTNYGTYPTQELVFDEYKFYNYTLTSVDMETYSNVSCSVCTESCSPCSGRCTATTLDNMYAGITDFTPYGSFSNWNTSCITSMQSTFANSNFNQNISSWNTASVNNFNGMFYNDAVFNQDLNSWNTQSVTDFNSMFSKATSFNQPVNNWNTQSVTDMDNMFFDAVNFNQDVSTWNVGNLNTAQQFLKNTSFNTTNYDKLLINWSSQFVNNGITLDVGNTMYTINGLAGHNILTDVINQWIIIDGGYNCSEVWVQYNTSCNGYNYTMLYNDTANCGTNLTLPINNGTLINCYVCVEDWIQNNTACNGVNYTIQYYDNNMCGTYNNLSVNNGTIVACTLPLTGLAGYNEQVTNDMNNVLFPILIIFVVISMLTGLIMSISGVDVNTMVSVFLVFGIVIILLLLLILLNPIQMLL